MGVAVRLLVRAHLRSRWKRYTLVAASFGLGLFAFFLVVMVTQGAQEAIVQPIEATLTGDVRVTNGTKELGAGAVLPDFRPLQARLEESTGASVTPRLESSYITIQGTAYANWSAGLLLGIDPMRSEEREAISPYMVWGRPLEGDLVFHPTTHKGYAPLLLGEPAVERLNLTLNASGEALFDQILILTSGRTIGEGNVPFLLRMDCVVVGVFKTGLEPLDKFTAYMPLASARTLAGFNEGDPVANALVLRGTGVDVDAVRAELRDAPELHAISSEEFSFGYMGSVLVILYAAATIGLALFLTVLFVWLLHETAVLVRMDQTVLASLRAVGVPARQIALSYSSLTALAVAGGALAALLITLVLGWTAPPIRWELEGISARIPWRVHGVALSLVTGVAVLASLFGAWAAARRVQQLNILEGLRET